MERPIWHGHLRLALVTCPVMLVTARRDRSTLHFNMINPDTGNRIRMVTVDAETGDELSRRDLVRGYEFRKDHYVLLSDEEFEQARIESSSTISIDKVVPSDTIDPLHVENSYYLLPEGEVGREVYTVLREALLRNGGVALSRLVLSRRERPVAIAPLGRGMVLHTLNEEADVLNADTAFEDIPKTKPDPAMVNLAVQLLDRQKGEFDPSDTEDRYETRLRELIDAKIRGEGFDPEPEEEEAPSNVIDLMSMLKASLDKKKPTSVPAPAATARAKPAKKAEPKPAAKAPAKAQSKKPAAPAPKRRRA